MLNPKKPRKIAGEDPPIDPNSPEARRKASAPRCYECGAVVTQSHGMPDFDEKGWFTPTTYTCPEGHTYKVRSTHEPMNTASPRDRSVERRIPSGF